MQGIIRKLFSAMIVVASLTFMSVSLVTVTGAPTAHADTISDIRDGVTGSGGGEAKNRSSRVPDVIKVVVNILLFFIGIFAVIMIVVAGFRLVAANGDANTVSQAKNTIIYAVIGIVVAFMAFALVNFIITQLTA